MWDNHAVTDKITNCWGVTSGGRTDRNENTQRTASCSVAMLWRSVDWWPHKIWIATNTAVRTSKHALNWQAACQLTKVSIIYRVSQEERTKLRESVPYVKQYRYNPKHLYPKLNGYGDNGQRSLKLWQLLHTYWLPNTYWNWQEYVVSVMLISVLNIKLTCEWQKAIKLNYKNTRTTVVFVLRFPSNLRRPQLMRYRAKVTVFRC